MACRTLLEPGETIHGVRAGRRTVLVFIALVLLSWSASALGEPVSRGHAELAVLGWLRTRSAVMAGSGARSVGEVDVIRGADGRPVGFAVGLEPEGYVLVAADDAIYPIVCFSARGRFDRSGANPLLGLAVRDLTGRVAALGQPHFRSAVGAQAKWAELMSLGEDASGADQFIAAAAEPETSDSFDVRVSPFLKTASGQTIKWGQTLSCTSPELACFNYHTPRSEGGQIVLEPGAAENYPTGCVATAMGQVMFFHQYPQEGIGTLRREILVDDRAVWVYTRGGDGLGGAYRWDLMLASPNCGTPADRRSAMGALCFDAGAVVGTSYGPDESSSDDPVKVAVGLTEVFGYGHAVTGSGNWANMGMSLLTMINTNLDAGSPVILFLDGVADGERAGHAGVCDGYAYDGPVIYHHLNLGWYGQNDMWYCLPDVSSDPPWHAVTACVYNIFEAGQGEIISGRVTDEQGATVGGAVVVAERQGGGVYTTTTGANGIYAFAAAPSDSEYTIRVTGAGYDFEERTVTTGLSQNGRAWSGNCWAVNFTPSPGGKVVYVGVEATGGRNDGSSWADAFVDLQDGIVAAAGSGAVTEIWVADGRYRPDRGTGLQTFSFGLVDGVAIYGGFAGADSVRWPGGETKRSQRNPARNVTVLTGDLAGNDRPGLEATFSENSYHVGNASGTRRSAVLDGFVITAGRAVGISSEDRQGGAVYAYDGAGQFVDCRFVGNRAQVYGGAVCVRQGEPVFAQCTFEDNTAGEGGGAVWIADGASSFASCRFASNRADRSGGAVKCEQAMVSLTDCHFEANGEVSFGGALFAQGGQVSGINCRFEANRATQGGAISTQDVEVSLIGCEFERNRAPVDKQDLGGVGGALSMLRGSGQLTGCRLTGNVAGSEGAGVYGYTTGYDMVNCIFSGNKAGRYGGANASSSCTTVTLRGCLVTGNKAGQYGGGVFSHDTAMSLDNCTICGNRTDEAAAGMIVFQGQATVTSTIFWANEAPSAAEIVVADGASIAVTYSDVADGRSGVVGDVANPAVTWGAGNKDVSPRFEQAGHWDPNGTAGYTGDDYWVAGVYRLRQGSGCVNAGLPRYAASAGALKTDVYGGPRLLDGRVDIGADEWSRPGLSDLNGDGKTNFKDFSALAEHWLAEGCASLWSDCRKVDIDRNTRIDIIDLTAIIDGWMRP